MTAPSTALSDQHVRDLVTTEGLDQTLFVEAGAGTGKTTLLVDRIVNLVLRQDVDKAVRLRSIAAITFTEAAAAELQSRIRARFEQIQAEATAAGDLARAQRCAAAIDESDLAAITTLHGFANRILGEFAVAAGLPPKVRVLDEVASQLAQEDRWQRFVDRLYQDDSKSELLVTASSLEIALEPRYKNQTTLRDLAAEFNQNWDRVGPLVQVVDDTSIPLDFAEFDAAVAHLESWIPTCQDPGDKLLANLRTIVPEMQALVAIDDPVRKLRVLANRSKWGEWKVGRGGKKLGWGVNPTEVKDDIKAVNEAMASVLAPITDRVLRQLAALVADEVVGAATARRDDGGLEFHDLLVLARNLLRTKPEARKVLHDRYTHVLLDEFQDTDPIQIELAVLIATDTDEVEGRSWSELHVAPGRLFFVGDPKQSIYRFRRADIGLFLDARDRFAGPDGSRQLTTNFRTVEPVADWVNAMFTATMSEEIPRRQPRYEPLVAHRTDGFDGACHLPVLLGGPHPDPKIRSGELRAVEAADVAAAVRCILDNPDDFKVEGRDKKFRRPELGDITILLPTRTSLPFLKAALDAHQLPFRIATGTLVYDTQEVSDALAALRVIDDPLDQISAIAALRSPLYGCSDVDLFTWKQAGGSWDHRRPIPDGLNQTHCVAQAFGHLNELWRERWFLTPSEMLERLLRDRQAPMLAFGASRPPDVWRRLRFLVEQARAFEETGAGGLRPFTDWALLQSSPMARVHEPLLPETDEQALSIQTIHGSKGLEFPITIVSGMTTQITNNRAGVSVLWPDDVGPPEIKLRKGAETMTHEPRADLEAEMDKHEKQRLAYVAATRARDHLIVSCHHKASKAEDTYGGRFWQVFQEPDNANLWRPGTSIGLDSEPGLAEPTQAETGVCDDSPGGSGETQSQLGLALDTREAWIAERARLLAPHRQARVTSATGLARSALGSQQSQTEEPIILVDQDDDGEDAHHGADDRYAALVERRRGRTGSAIGSAVHAVLQTLNLADPQGVRDLVDQQSYAHRVPQHAFVISQLVESVLNSQAVALAATHVHHKELFVAAPLNGRTIEGYVDLLIETQAGLVVVDYKTDSARTEAEIDEKIRAYELQAAAYAVALERATGLVVSDCVFVFASTSGATERSVQDLAAAMARVRAVLAATSD